MGCLGYLEHSSIFTFFAAYGQLPMISATPFCFSRPLLSLSFPNPQLKFTALDQQKKTKPRIQTCRAHLSDDAPFALAIATSMLSSLVLPVSDAPSPEHADSAIDSTDTRFAVMGILSFIPYFNWLSWVFAWLDTGKRRYAVYSLVYLAPYLRSNLSLSPEESWLPIASIVFCIVHIQLEASIKNGDIQGLQIFREAVNRLSSTVEEGRLDEHEEMSKKESKKEYMNLPPSQEQSREIGSWEDPKRPIQHLNEDLDEDERSKH